MAEYATSDRCWCGYEPANTSEGGRLHRWQRAAKTLETAPADLSWDHISKAMQEESDAWDAMAEHDDPYYVQWLTKE